MKDKKRIQIDLSHTDEDPIRQTLIKIAADEKMDLKPYLEYILIGLATNSKYYQPVKSKPKSKP